MRSPWSNGSGVAHRMYGRLRAFWQPHYAKPGILWGFVRCLEVAWAVTQSLLYVINVSLHVCLLIELREAGRSTLVYLLLASICLILFVYALLIAEGLAIPDAFAAQSPVVDGRSVWRPLRWALAPILAPFAPLIKAGIEVASAPRATRYARLLDLGYCQTQAAREELDRPLNRLCSYLSTNRKEFVRHFPFYIEAGLLALPQAIIAIGVVFHDGHLSEVHQWALLAAVLDLGAKAAPVCVAFDARVVPGKFLLLLHDLASTFFLYATLFADETVSDRTVLGTELRVSWLTYLWLWKVVVCAGFPILTALVAVLITILRRGVQTGDKVCSLLGFIALVGFYPVIAATVEFFRISCFFFAVTASEPQFADWPVHCGLLSFLDDDENEPYEKQPRLRHLAIQWPVIAAISSYAPLIPTQVLVLANPISSHVVAHPHAVPNEQKLRAVALSPAPITLWSIHRIMHQWARSRHHLRQTLTKQQSHVALGVYAWLVFVVYICAQLFSFCYPFLYVALNPGHYAGMTRLQEALFITSAVTFFLALLCTPALYRYWRFNVCMQKFLARPSMPNLAVLIATFHQPDAEGSLQHTAVPAEVLPADVVGLVAEYVTGATVGLGDLSIEESREVRVQVARARRVGMHQHLASKVERAMRELPAPLSAHEHAVDTHRSDENDSDSARVRNEDGFDDVAADDGDRVQVEMVHGVPTIPGLAMRWHDPHGVVVDERWRVTSGSSTTLRSTLVAPPAALPAVTVPRTPSSDSTATDTPSASGGQDSPLSLPRPPTGDVGGSSSEDVFANDGTAKGARSTDPTSLPPPAVPPPPSAAGGAEEEAKSRSRSRGNTPTALPYGSADGSAGSDQE